MKKTLGNETFDNALIFLTLLFSSMNGAKIGSISLTKLALLPLLIVLIRRSRGGFKPNSATKSLFSYFFIILISSLIGLMKESYYRFESYEAKLFNNVLQMIILYIPICLLIMGKQNKETLCNSFERGFVLLARINCVWAIAQFLTWSLFKIDLNTYVFIDLFKGFFGSDWSAFNTEFNGYAYVRTIRVSGLNPESASLALVLLMGYMFEGNKYFKYLYITSIMLSMSRTGILVIMIYIVKQGLRHFDGFKVKRKMIQKFAVFICLGLTFFAICIKTDLFPYISQQLITLINRFLQIKDFGSASGTTYHMMYLFWALQSWLFELNPLEKLIGIGFRTSGIGLSFLESANALLPKLRMQRAWAIENDYSDILLGQGLIGLFLIIFFYRKIYSISDKRIKDFVICMCAFGFLYNPSAWTITHVIFFYLSLEYSRDINCKKSKVVGKHL